MNFVLFRARTVEKKMHTMKSKPISAKFKDNLTTIYMKSMKFPAICPYAKKNDAIFAFLTVFFVVFFDCFFFSYRSWYGKSIQKKCIPIYLPWFSWNNIAEFDGFKFGFICILEQWKWNQHELSALINFLSRLLFIYLLDSIQKVFALVKPAKWCNNCLCSSSFWLHLIICRMITINNYMIIIKLYGERIWWVKGH